MQDGWTELAHRIRGKLAGVPRAQLTPQAILAAFEDADFDKMSEIRARVDGIVADTARCQKVFKLSDLQCPAGKADGCLSAPQVAALQRSMDGPRNSRGQQLYSDWSFDPGMAAGGDHLHARVGDDVARG